MKPKTLRCAIYTRKSSEEGLDQDFNSLHAQREACEAYIRSQIGEGWTALPAQYDDGGFSGGTLERPAVQHLLADIDGGRIDVVVVYKVDRLTRSLADFAKIVERFDAKGVSFVSITQQFNTTSSMGRLTLNVLLSFAQFEREVTSERIRDKVAASKRKGMWMGGNPPLGYDNINRRLAVNEREAPLVRMIFERYLELGSVLALREDLTAKGLLSKSWLSRRGHQRGGVLFDRGALYGILQSRIYVGDVGHKGVSHKGNHQAIVPSDLFDRVQAHLSSNRRRQKERTKTRLAFPLTGLIFDDRGNPMSPSYAQKIRTKRYRYYVSRLANTGQKSEAGSLARIPAQAIEDLVQDRVARVLKCAQVTPDADSESGSSPSESGSLTSLRRIDIGANEVTVHIDRSSLSDLGVNGVGRAVAKKMLAKLTESIESTLVDGDEMELTEHELILRIPVRLKRWGGEKQLVGVRGAVATQRPKVDRALLKAIARAHGWVDALVSGDAQTISVIAKRDQVTPAYIRRIMQLAFLAPPLLEAVLSGQQRSALTVDRLARVDLSPNWDRQMRDVDRSRPYPLREPNQLPLS